MGRRAIASPKVNVLARVFGLPGAIMTDVPVRESPNSRRHGFACIDVQTSGGMLISSGLRGKSSCSPCPPCPSSRRMKSTCLRHAFFEMSISALHRTIPEDLDIHETTENGHRANTNHPRGLFVEGEARDPAQHGRSRSLTKVNARRRPTLTISGSLAPSPTDCDIAVSPSPFTAHPPLRPPLDRYRLAVTFYCQLSPLS